MEHFPAPQNPDSEKQKSMLDQWKEHLEQTPPGTTSDDLWRTFMDKQEDGLPKSYEVIPNYLKQKAEEDGSYDLSLIEAQQQLASLPESLNNVELHFSTEEEISAPSATGTTIKWKIVHGEKGHYLLHQSTDSNTPKYRLCTEKDLTDWGNQ